MCYVWYFISLTLVTELQSAHCSAAGLRWFVTERAHHYAEVVKLSCHYTTRPTDRLVLLISGQLLSFGQSEHTLTTHTCNVQHAHTAPAALSKSREINTAWTFRITSRSLPCLCAVCESIGCACFYWCMEHAKSQPSPHSTHLSVFVSDEKQVVGVETVCHCSLSFPLTFFKRQFLH